MDLENPLPLDEIDLPSRAVLRRLKISSEVAAYLLTRRIPLPEVAPLLKTPEPSRVPGAAFSFARVDAAMRAFAAMRHTQGEWAGRPLIPEPWQVAHIIAPVYGWIIESEDFPGKWVRIIRNVTVDVPRKAGKTTISGGVALMLTGADGESGAQVLAAASSKYQAGFLFEPIKQLAEHSPALASRFTVNRDVLTHKKSFSTFRVVSSRGEALHGANVHGAVIDEIHVHKRGDLIEAIETGVGARAQPLVFKITTADENKSNTPYSNNRKRIERLANGVLKDESTYGVIFAANDDDDPFKEATWKKANPGYGVTPTKSYMRTAANKAKNSTADLASFKRLHLGIRGSGRTGWVSLKEWDRNAGSRIHEADLLGRACYGGLDLSSSEDLTALCWLFPAHERGTACYDVLWRFWYPEDSIGKLDERTSNNASAWVKDGWLTLTPGNVVDYDFIDARIRADSELFDVESIGYDRWGATQLTNSLTEDGIPMIKVGQGYASMNPTMKEFQRLTKLGAKGRVTESVPHLRHGGNPVMRWMIDNLAVKMDPAGNVKPAKDISADKIDGVAALMNALFECMSMGGDTASAYEDHGVRGV